MSVEVLFAATRSGIGNVVIVAVFTRVAAAYAAGRASVN